MLRELKVKVWRGGVALVLLLAGLLQCGCGKEGDGTGTPPDPTFPRLFVANAGASHKGVRIWDNVDALASDLPADATLGGLTDGALALALCGQRLFVACESATDPVYIYDDASGLSDGSPNDDTLSVAAFNGAPLTTVYEMSVDGSARLWVCYGYIRLFLNAGVLSNSSPSQAQFTHPWGAQIYSMAAETSGDRLIGGQVSGDGAIVWDSPAAKTGETNDNDWQLFPFGPPTKMAIAGDRLYAGSYNSGGGSGYVNIWNGVSSVSSAKPPDVTMTAASNLGSAVHVTVKDDVLVVTVTDVPTYKVNVYRNASAISGETTPDFEITDASMSLPKKSYLADDGRLYVLDSDGILIFKDATTAPQFVVEITTGVSSPRDFLLVE